MIAAVTRRARLSIKPSLKESLALCVDDGSRLGYVMFDQIKDLSDSYVACDDIELGIGNKIPLWLFGFLY